MNPGVFVLIIVISSLRFSNSPGFQKNEKQILSDWKLFKK